MIFCNSALGVKIAIISAVSDKHRRVHVLAQDIRPEGTFYITKFYKIYFWGPMPPTFAPMKVKCHIDRCSVSIHE